MSNDHSDAKAFRGRSDDLHARPAYDDGDAKAFWRWSNDLHAWPAYDDGDAEAFWGWSDDLHARPAYDDGDAEAFWWWSNDLHAWPAYNDGDAKAFWRWSNDLHASSADLPRHQQAARQRGSAVFRRSAIRSGVREALGLVEVTILKRLSIAHPHGAASGIESLRVRTGVLLIA